VLKENRRVGCPEEKKTATKQEGSPSSGGDKETGKNKKERSLIYYNKIAKEKGEKNFRSKRGSLVHFPYMKKNPTGEMDPIPPPSSNQKKADGPFSGKGTLHQGREHKLPRKRDGVLRRREAADGGKGTDDTFGKEGGSHLTQEGKEINPCDKKKKNSTGDLHEIRIEKKGGEKRTGVHEDFEIRQEKDLDGGRRAFTHKHPKGGTPYSPKRGEGLTFLTEREKNLREPKREKAVIFPQKVGTRKKEGGRGLFSGTGKETASYHNSGKKMVPTGEKRKGDEASFHDQSWESRRTEEKEEPRTCQKKKN